MEILSQEVKMEFEQLLEEYKPFIWHIINEAIRKAGMPSNHADDMFQEACIRLYEKLQTYDPDKSSYKTFVASNTEIACMRYRRAFFLDNPAELFEDTADHRVDTDGAAMELVNGYQTSKLNRKIIQRKLEGYTQQEIAKEFTLSQSTVSRVLSEFKDYLIDHMKSQ